MKQYLKLIALTLIISLFAPAYAQNEQAAESDFSMSEEAEEELAMSKKSGYDIDTEYDYRGNPIKGSSHKGSTKHRKQKYKGPVSRKNTSSNDDEEEKTEEAVY